MGMRLMNFCCVPFKWSPSKAWEDGGYPTTGLVQLGLDSLVQGSRMDGEEAEFEGVTVSERTRCKRLGPQSVTCVPMSVIP